MQRSQPPTSALACPYAAQTHCFHSRVWHRNKSEASSRYKTSISWVPVSSLIFSKHSIFSRFSGKMIREKTGCRECAHYWIPPRDMWRGGASWSSARSVCCSQWPSRGDRECQPMRSVMLAWSTLPEQQSKKRRKRQPDVIPLQSQGIEISQIKLPCHSTRGCHSWTDPAMPLAVML